MSLRLFLFEKRLLQGRKLMCSGGLLEVAAKHRTRSLSSVIVQRVSPL